MSQVPFFKSGELIDYLTVLDSYSGNPDPFGVSEEGPVRGVDEPSSYLSFF